MTRNDLPSRSNTKVAMVLGVLMTLLFNAGLSNANAILNAPPGCPTLPASSSVNSCPISAANAKRGDKPLQPSNSTSFNPESRRFKGETENRRNREPPSSSTWSSNNTRATIPAMKQGRVHRDAHARRFHHDDNAGRSRRLRSRQPTGKAYSLVDWHEGSTFFDGWDFFEYPDPTHGMITYVSAAEAHSSGLAYVQGDGVAIMTVDTNSTLSSGAYRKSVRVTTKKSYNKGLFVFDILRGPYGCAVWPAAWLVGPNWPSGGEIDVIEGVHNSAYNQATIHSNPGCMLDTTKSIAGGVFLALGTDPTEVFTGTALEGDCDATINYNAGCGVLDMDSRSYGAGLNSNGGGVYATLWDETGVRIWFFTRGVVPADITGKSPDPSTWGSPMAYWAASSCAPSFFNDLSVVFDIVLGGDWAGATFSEAGCPGALADYVANPANFATANWAVNSVRVYQ